MKKRFRKIYVEITNICNLNCSFCPKTIRKLEFMTVQNFEYIAKQIQEYTDLIYLHVKGEPLLHQDLENILDLCNKYNLKVNLTTNGTLLKEKISILKETKAIRQINISIHSSMVNNNDNEYIEKYMTEIVNSSNKIDDKIISYRLWNVKNNESIEKNKEILDILGNKYGIKDLFELACKNNWVKLKENVYLNQDSQFKWPNVEAKEISKVGKCLGLKEQIAILVNGDVVPCCLDENANMKLGNIFNTKLEDILNDKYTKEVIEGFNNNVLVSKLCRTCGFRKRFDK